MTALICVFDHPWETEAGDEADAGKEKVEKDHVVMKVACH